MSKWKLSHISAGLTAVTVGYSSSVVIIIDVARKAGASDDMVVSWLLALGLGMGITCILFSWLSKLPVVTAWSTPGAAFLLTSIGDYRLSEAIGAFILCALLSLVTAQSRSLLKQISRIPPAISSALLAGILLPICLAIFSDVNDAPYLVALFIAAYLVGSRLFPRYLMLLLLIMSVTISLFMSSADGVVALSSDSPGLPSIFTLPEPIWVTPTFSLSAAIGLAFPLFLITTLSQNLPGIAIHHAHGYTPDHKPILSGIAIVQALLAPFGGFTFNLAAITAALCMGEQADDEKSQRYKAAIAAGVAYLFMGLLASVVVALFVSMPSIIIHLLAGLALLATLQGAVVRAMEVEHHRAPALLTMLCTASGFSLYSMTSAVWGLGLGLLLLYVQKKPVSA
ncbi:benzoate/H(+) symporter BenE family transporter [Alteromonas sp. DY56-G5]|jgi:benzoate membrane transport protein|uniref:Benzoate transport protein n=2 Tax=Alteromonas TaxID=226 RepID=A0AB32ZUV8_ALTME|nr:MULTISPECIES: benzoate/H(+) symporter BenE family transporter [Alteromonas]MCG8497311.1 benzoate/H(+) symporter BenE family transporter [Enterobacterales bacterium]MEC7080801.1 benzoate/H(+) symporter BenE family transporter [Pseudomonadota bacterium]AFT73343.1 benzoate transport protein [Alteromonas macleodii str. 'English Channel 673']AMN10699.1 benzoate transporter [Alteromonas macleodii]MCS5577447.1 benzoate/H(+) symporter BenE family transporter [Alteromonas macleodii]|tara:strand:- start:1594 stop:2784 length:1191 start_codon:yes stop_codon:yes gene_type:complete